MQQYSKVHGIGELEILNRFMKKDTVCAITV